MTFAAAIPAIISGGVAGRAKFWPQIVASTGQEFHDFAGSVVVHAVGGWLALPAIVLLGARANRYRKDGSIGAHPPSNIPFLALVLGKNDPGFIHNGPLAGLVAVCAGSDLMHPLGALLTGAIAGAIFVVMFTLTQNRWKIDDVLGVWPLHGLCGTWGGLAAGIFGSKALGGLGGVALSAQLIGTGLGVVWALLSGVVVYTLLKATMGLRLSQEEECEGADLSIHRIGATHDREVNW